MARAAIRELKVRIKGEDKVSTVFAGVSRSSNQMSASFAGVRAGLNQVGAAFGVVTAAGGVFIAMTSKAVSASAKQATGINQLDRALRSANSSYIEAGEGIEEFAAQQQATTRFGDDETRAVLANLIQLTGDYGDHTLQAAQAVQDMAEGAQMPLNSASRLVSQAIAGNISSLTRYIPSLRGMKAETFAAMEATERTAVVVDALNETFGGAATAIDPVAQKMANLRNTAGDIMEAFGDAVREGGVFEIVLDGLLETMTGLKTMIEDNADSIQNTFVVAMVAGVRPAQFMLFTIKGLHQAIFSVVQLADPLMEVLKASAGVVGPVSLFRNIDKIAEAWGGVFEKLQDMEQPLDKIDEKYAGHVHWLQQIENRLLNVKSTAGEIEFPLMEFPSPSGGGGGGGGRAPRAAPGAGGTTGGGLVFEEQQFAGFGAFDELAGRSAFDEEMAAMLAGPGERMGPPAELAEAQSEASAAADALASSAGNLGRALGAAAGDTEDAMTRIASAVIASMAQMAAASIGGPFGGLVGGLIGGFGGVIAGGARSGVGGRRSGARNARARRQAEGARMVRG